MDKEDIHFSKKSKMAANPKIFFCWCGFWNCIALEDIIRDNLWKFGEDLMITKWDMNFLKNPDFLAPSNIGPEHTYSNMPAPEQSGFHLF